MRTQFTKDDVGKYALILNAYTDSDKIGQTLKIVQVTDHSVFLDGCRNAWDNPSTNLKLITKKSPMQKISTMFKLLVDADTQTLKKAGFINGDLELTQDGIDALNAIQFAANKAALVTEAQAKIDEEKADK